MTGNATVVNFSGGETSPRSRGRFDQPWYQTSAKKLLNYQADIQGPARFRTGFVFGQQSRLGQVARGFDFTISDVLAYLLEFTPGYLRVRNPTTQQLLTTTDATITAVTAASPAVVTVADSSALLAGQEVVLSGFAVDGLAGLNNGQYLIANLNQVAKTFNLADPVTGALLDTSAYPAHTSGGTASVVYELTTSYSAIDLQSLQVAATDGIMYITCPRQVPQKLTVDAYGNFSINAYNRTNDPFALSAVAVTVTNLKPVYVAELRTGTIAPSSAATGTNVVFTASVSGTFSAADVGKYIRDVSGTHGGAGYALITAFTNSTSVKCTITSAFGDTVAIAAGAWQVVTVETQVTLASASIVNASLTYVLSSVGGATQANTLTVYLVSLDKAGTTSSQKFYIRNTDNTAIDSSAWGAYTSGGKATPSSAQTSITLKSITRGLKTIVTFTTGAVVNPNVGYTFSGVGGTTQLNGQTYWLKTESGQIHLTLVDGTEVNSTGWTAFTHGGIATASAENPIGVAFYEGRLIFAGTNQRPDCLFLSRGPDSSGNSRYDDFTGGTNADFACFFQLAPTGGSASFISWARGGPDYLFIGTFGGPYRVSGSGLDIPITPTSINVRQFDTAGAEETMPAGLQQVFFVQRAGATLRSIKVINPYLATFESADMCLNAEQVGYSPIQRVVLQRGRPDTLWVFCANGLLAGMSVRLTVQASETLTGWHRHQLGGDGVVVDLVTMPRQTGFDQLWAVVQRTVNGASRCYFEVMADDVVFPDPEDFYATSGPIVKSNDDPSRQNTSASYGSQAEDLQNWKNAVWRLQERYVHLDSQLAYDGSLRGTTAGATLTPSDVGTLQVEGQAAASTTLTASAAVFAATDVGSEIWVKPSATTGLGAGRATITAYVSPTQVTATVTVLFSSTAAVAAGDWYFAASSFYGFGHLEGEQVAVVADGAVFSDGGQTGDEDFPTITVSKGAITLPAGSLGQQPRAAVLRAGLPYLGMVETHNLEMGGRLGPAQSKPRNISEVNIRFLSTLGCEYGTDLYKMQKVEHRLSSDVADRPAPVFSGIRRLKLEDSWSGLEDPTREKTVKILQRLPLPSIVQFLDISYSTTDGDGGQE